MQYCVTWVTYSSYKYPLCLSQYGLLSNVKDCLWTNSAHPSDINLVVYTKASFQGIKYRNAPN